MTHICISKLTIICTDNGLLPGWHHAIIRTNAGILFTGTLETNFSEILSKIHIFLSNKMQMKMSTAKWWAFCHGPIGLSVTYPKPSGVIRHLLTGQSLAQTHVLRDIWYQQMNSIIMADEAVTSGCNRSLTACYCLYELWIPISFMDEFGPFATESSRTTILNAKWKTWICV